VPDSVYKDQPNLIPLTIAITDDSGAPRGVLRYFPWIDGAVLAWRGNIPLPPLLLPLGDIGLKMTTRHEGVDYFNPITLTQAEFRQWPEKLNKSLTNLRAQLSGFVLKQVLNEGTSEPFMARLLASMIEMRDRVVENTQESQAFDTAYSPVLDKLIEARRACQLNSATPDSGGGLTGAVVPGASFGTLANAALRALPSVCKFFNLEAEFLFEPDPAFNEGVASLYAHDPILATYLLGCRADWLKQWADAHQGGSDDAALPSPGDMSVTLGRVAALVENVCVHLLAAGLAKRTKSLVVVETPAGKRNPEYTRRFEVVLAAEGVTPWTLEYRATGFGDQ
jgi:hypothetical protein